MNLRFHMQHDQSAGLQNGEILPGRESKMATNTKIAKPKKLTFFSRMAWYIWEKFCKGHKWALMFKNIKMKKKSVAELVYCHCLKIMSTLAKFLSAPACKSIQMTYSQKPLHQ